MELIKNKLVWYFVTFLLVVLIGHLVQVELSQKEQISDIGTYKNPELAWKETRKELEVLSKHINFGMENVLYIKEYENSKNLIFKK